MSRPDHVRFLAALGRRVALVRAVEALAVAAGGASIVSLPIVAALRWSGRPVAIACGSAAFGAAVVAAGRLARRWPSRARAAELADHHFAWDDLLATASTVSRGEAGFATAVRATADARCRAVRPSLVPVRQIGRGSWATVVAAGAAWVAVVAVPTRPGAGRADRRAEAAVDVLAADVDPPPFTTITASSPQDRAAAPSQFDLADDRRVGSAATTADATPGRPGEGDTADRAPGRAGGTGRGTSTTDTPAPTAGRAAMTASPPRDARGSTIGGGGDSAARHPSGSDRSTSMTGGGATVKIATRDRAGVGPLDPAAAVLTRPTDAPARDRGLISAYFGPHDLPGPKRPASGE